MTGASASASPLSVSSVAQLALSLLAIVALILAIGWVLKRLRLAGPRGRGDLSVLDELALGPRERILLIRVGDAQVLIGIGAGTVVGLTPLAANISLQGSPPVPVFADRLREFMKRPGAST
jgi:flagellar protein FliO/FliZ